MTAMHYAAQEGKSVEVLEVLRDAGAEVDKTTEGGYTPLMHAADSGATGAVRDRYAAAHCSGWRKRVACTSRRAAQAA